MIQDAALADRRREVRVAARAWREAGAIDEAARGAIEAAYPDDRARHGIGLRILFAVFTALGVLAGYGFLVLLASAGGTVTGAAVLAICFGFVLAMATEVQIGPNKRADAGTEEATAFLAPAFLVAGISVLLLTGETWRSESVLWSIFGVAAALCALAAWRWGFALHAAAAAIFAFCVVASLPAGRILWLALAAGAYVPLLRGAESPRFAPSHRRCCAAALIVAVAAAWLAVWIRPLDLAFVESLGGRPGSPDFGTTLERLMTFDGMLTSLVPGSAGGAPGQFPGATHQSVPTPPAGWLRCVSVLATVGLPLALLAHGARSRRRLLLVLGALTALSALAALPPYFPFAPLWVQFCVGGAACFGCGLLLRRWLSAAPGGERGGFTAEPLFERTNRLAVLELAAASLTLTPSPEGAEHHADDFEAGGGESGGAGAGGKY